MDPRERAFVDVLHSLENAARTAGRPGGVRLLAAECLGLLLDRLIEAGEEVLVIAPRGLRQPVLGSLSKTGAVLVAILKQHVELAPGIAFCCQQASKAQRRLIATPAHQLEYHLQGERSAHDESADQPQAAHGPVRL